MYLQNSPPHRDFYQLAQSSSKSFLFVFYFFFRWRKRTQRTLFCCFVLSHSTYHLRRMLMQCVDGNRYTSSNYNKKIYNEKTTRIFWSKCYAARESTQRNEIFIWFLTIWTCFLCFNDFLCFFSISFSSSCICLVLCHLPLGRWACQKSKHRPVTIESVLPLNHRVIMDRGRMIHTCLS